MWCRVQKSPFHQLLQVLLKHALLGDHGPGASVLIELIWSLSLFQVLEQLSWNLYINPILKRFVHYC